MDAIDGGTPHAPDALVLEGYLAGREAGGNPTSPFGAAIEKPMALVAVKESPSNEPAIRRFVNHLEQCGVAHASTVTDDGILVTLMSHKSAVRLDNVAHDDWPARVRSYPFGSEKFIKPQFEIMRYALDRADRNDDRALAPTLWFLKEKVARGEDMDDYLHPALEAIRKSDEENGTEYFKTLATFLKHDSRAQRAGQELFLHRNAVLYRLKKVEKITGADLQDPQERAYLRFSFLLGQHGPSNG